MDSPGCKMKTDEIVNTLTLWIKSFSWEENDCRTDAEMHFSVSGMDGENIEDMVDVAAIDTEIIKQVVLRKAADFLDVYVIEELDWRMIDTADKSGLHKSIQVDAVIHLAKSGMPFDEL